MRTWSPLNSVRHKLLAGVLAATLLALLVTVAALMTFDLRTFTQILERDMTTQAELIGRASAAALQFDDPRAARTNLELLRVRPRVRAAAIYDAKGARFASYSRASGAHPGFPSLPGAEGLSVDDGMMTIFQRVVVNNQILGTVYLLADHGRRERVAHYTGVALAVTVVALALSLLLSLWLQRILSQPIQEIAGMARRVIDHRDYTARAKKTTDDEIGYLATAFNDMLTEIGRRTAALEQTNARLQGEIAERERVADALRRSEQRYRSLVEATAQIIWVADARGMVSERAPSWQAYTGQSDAEVFGEGWSKALHPEDGASALRAWRKCVDSGVPFEYEYRVRRADGEYRWFAVRGVPVRNVDGTVREWVRICIDIHDRRRAEQEIRRLNDELETRVRERTAQLVETNRELEAFAYSVSHDLRAPLRAIDGFSQALVEDAGPGADAGTLRHIERIRAATQRMGCLIDDLLSLSRISRVELVRADVDLSALARQVAKDLQQREPERIVEWQIWDDIGAQGDPRLLRVVLENLIANSWKFTSRCAQARIEFGALHEAHRVVYFVRDNGAGFDMAYAEKLFGAFQRLHSAAEYSGTGIGLATVQRVIHRHRGRIWARAQPGKGAVFFFTLDPETSDVAAPDTAAEASGA